ncbi:MAG: hypothetical protein QG570_308 [Patescibacteria group bacterium]|nr:hypothetical protein [Patescibacteria group bacterium]
MSINKGEHNPTETRKGRGEVAVEALKDAQLRKYTVIAARLYLTALRRSRLHQEEATSEKPSKSIETYEESFTTMIKLLSNGTLDPKLVTHDYMNYNPHNGTRRVAITFGHAVNRGEKDNQLEVGVTVPDTAMRDEALNAQSYKGRSPERILNNRSSVGYSDIIRLTIGAKEITRTLDGEIIVLGYTGVAISIDDKNNICGMCGVSKEQNLMLYSDDLLQGNEDLKLPIDPDTVKSLVAMSY